MARWLWGRREQLLLRFRFTLYFPKNLVFQKLSFVLSPPVLQSFDQVPSFIISQNKPISVLVYQFKGHQDCKSCQELRGVSKFTLAMKHPVVYSRLAGVHLRDGVKGDGRPLRTTAWWALMTGGECLKQREECASWWINFGAVWDYNWEEGKEGRKGIHRCSHLMHTLTVTHSPCHLSWGRWCRFHLKEQEKCGT